MAVAAPAHPPDSGARGSTHRPPATTSRRQARWRRRYGAVVLLGAAAGVAAAIGVGGHGAGGAGTAAAARALEGQSPAAGTPSASPLAPLPAGIIFASAIAFDPRTPNTVYIAATSGKRNFLGEWGRLRGRVYKTSDAGHHWHSVGSGPISTRVDALAADPRRPGTLYAGTGVAAYKTVDGGRSWLGWNRGLLPPPPAIKRLQAKGTPGWRRSEGWVGALAVDPADSHIVWAGSGGGVKKSTDGGRSWKTMLWRGRYMGVEALAIATTRPHTVYAGVTYSMPADCGAGSAIRCSENAVLLSTTDGGTTWQPTGLAPAGSASLAALVVDPKRPSTLYAAVGATILASNDAGERWQVISHGGGSDDQALPGNHRISSLTVDRSGAVFAAVTTNDGGIFKTTDAGATWAHVVAGIAVDHIAVNPRQPATIFAVGTQWTATGTSAVHADKTLVLRSTDGGRTWAIAG
jgi:photosystem II stability/assembly factor-like uncharacterized protein